MSAQSFLPESGHRTILERLRIKRDREAQSANIEANQQNLKDQIAAQAENLEKNLQAQQERQIEQIGATARLQDDAQLQQQQMLERELFGQEILQERAREDQAEQADLDRQFQKESQQASFQQANKQQDKSISAQADAQEAENQQRILELEEEARLRKSELDARLLAEKELQSERLQAERDIRQEEMQREDALRQQELQLQEQQLEAAQKALSDGRKFNDTISVERRKQAAEELRVQQMEIQKAKVARIPSEKKAQALTKAGVVVQRVNESYNAYRELGGSAAGILADDKLGDEIFDGVLKNQDRTFFGIRGEGLTDPEDLGQGMPTSGPTYERLRDKATAANRKVLDEVSREVGRRLTNQIVPVLEEITQDKDELRKIEDSFNDIIEAAYQSAPGTTRFMDDELVKDNLKAVKAAVKTFLGETGAAGNGLLQEISSAAEIQVRNILEQLPPDTSMDEALVSEDLSRADRERLIVLGGLTNITSEVDSFRPMSKDEYAQLFTVAFADDEMDGKQVEYQLLNNGWTEGEIQELRSKFTEYRDAQGELELLDENILEAQRKIQESLLSISELEEDRDFNADSIIGAGTMNAIRQYRELLGEDN